MSDIPRRRRLLIWGAVAMAAVLVSAVTWIALPTLLALGARVVDDFRKPDPGQPMPVASAQLGGSVPGSLVSATTMPGFINTVLGGGLEAARVVYRSTSGDTGDPTVVSGAVVVPTSPAPPGGWPVIAFGHGTTGIQQPCAPSLSDSLMGLSESVAAIAREGYAVAIPDYQGLGEPGLHPYTDARTAGLNMIDAVRALRATFGDISPRWVAFGSSQGGGASWAADEQAATYAGELDLLGAVAVSPPADIVGMVAKAQVGSLTPDQMPAWQAVVESLARLHPDIDRDDFRRGSAQRNWDTLSACSGPQARDRPAAAAALTPPEVAPASPEAADRVRGYLQGWALPQRPLSAPLYVWYGGEDTYIDDEWTTAAIGRACALGGSVDWEFEQSKGHGEADFAVVLRWMADRFAGKAAADDCT